MLLILIMLTYTNLDVVCFKFLIRSERCFFSGGNENTGVTGRF